jgi:hypothetical protein
MAFSSTFPLDLLPPWAITVEPSVENEVVPNNKKQDNVMIVSALLFL